MKEEDINHTEKAAEAAAKGEKVPQQEKESGGKQAVQLVALAKKNGDELFFSLDGEPYALVQNGSRLDAIKITSSTYLNLLKKRFYDSKKNIPDSQAIKDAAGMLAAMAEFEGKRYQVYTRVGSLNGNLYLDLCNDAGEVAVITPDGWHLTQEPGVKFRRTQTMKPLPRPVKGGNIDELRQFLNVKSNKDWVLLVGWLLASLAHHINHAILVFHGNWGSAKSTATKLLRMLVDDDWSPLKGDPSNVRDLLISATHTWCLAFDNLSHIPKWLSDALCRLATGGGLGARRLYTDDEEKVFDVKRPVILNGITEIVTKPDLLSRSQIIYLPSIPADKRKYEEDLMKEFEEARPRILGALLTAASTALRNLPNTKPQQVPRLADYARFVTSGEESFGWKPDSFMAAYKKNQEGLNQLALEASIIFRPFKKFTDDRVSWSQPWEGTAQALLDELDEKAGDRLLRGKFWPQTPQHFSNLLREQAANLKEIGIEITFGRSRDKDRERLITIQKVPIKRDEK